MVLTRAPLCNNKIGITLFLLKEYKNSLGILILISSDIFLSQIFYLKFKKFSKSYF